MFFTGFAGNYQVKANMKTHAVAAQLSTIPVKPVLMHSGIGYEQYGESARAGYYSYPRLQTQGWIEIEGEKIEVEGELWYDRQWNCMGVWHNKLGWDWMSIQLDNQEEIMVYQVNDFREQRNQILGGTYYTATLENIHLTDNEIELEPTKFWTSDKSGVTYPIQWKLQIPSHDIDLKIEAQIPHQELQLKYRVFSMEYWEGMCAAEGTIGDQIVKGDSYIEMTKRKLMNKFMEQEAVSMN